LQHEGMGICEIWYVMKVANVEALSYFTLKRKGKQMKVQVKPLACSNAHCIALNIGYEKTIRVYRQ
jgi:hypothetical protein